MAIKTLEDRRPLDQADIKTLIWIWDTGIKAQQQVVSLEVSMRMQDTQKKTQELLELEAKFKQTK